MKVRIASENDKEKWDYFVDQEMGSFHHYFDWKYYYETNPSKNRFTPLIIENDASEVLGIFPIEENLRLLYGSLSSLPLGVSDGFLIKKSLGEPDRKTVIQSFLDYIDANYADSYTSITIKEHLNVPDVSITPTQILIENGYEWLDNTTTQLPCTHILKLEKPFKEKIWMGLWSKTFRKRIRQVRKSGIEVITDDEFTHVDDFVEMQIKSAEKFGRVHSREDILPIFKIFRNKIKLFVCLQASKPISAALCYFTPTMVHCSMAPYTPAATDYLTNTLPVCASINYACEHGYNYYDMGLTYTEEIAHHKDKFLPKRIPLKIYTKKFSHRKVITNDSFEYLKRWGTKMIGSL